MFPLPCFSCNLQKAGGDVKRKGKPDPFAYVPLNPASLNRRKRAKHQGEMTDLLKSSKKNGREGPRQQQQHKGQKGRS